jgi:hypothetical protein
MTEHAPHGQVRSEEDRISTPRILVVGIGSLVLFFVASVVTAGYLRMRQGQHPVVPIPAEIGSSKIGLVEQQLFDRAVRGERDRAVREERLRSYGWVDRRQGIVHIPIERAMELVAGGARPAPGGAPEPTQPGGQP